MLCIVGQQKRVDSCSEKRDIGLYIISFCLGPRWICLAMLFPLVRNLAAGYFCGDLVLAWKSHGSSKNPIVSLSKVQTFHALQHESSDRKLW